MSNLPKSLLLVLLMFIIPISLLLLQARKRLSQRASAVGGLSTVTYQSTNEDIANPERGFMKQSSIYLDQPFDPNKIRVLQATDTVVWIYFRLDNYRDPRDGIGITVQNYQGKTLEAVGSGRGLDVVRASFEEARKKGLKLVIRFIYNWGPGSTTDPMQANPDVPLSVVLQHIDQLKPLIVADADVIVAVQAGFVGHWGEWHSSKYLSSLANRKAIVDKLLTAVPVDRMLQVRYPRYVENFYGGPISDSLAFNQSNLSRIGIHDDAFLREDTDGNTFTSTALGQKVSTYCDGSANTIQCWRDYYAQTSKFTPSGGEAGTHSSTPSIYAECPNALAQMNNLHFSFLHNGYAKVVLDHWINQGCMPEIRQRLGYRIVLSRLNIANQVAAGGNMEFHLELENKGFASPFNLRPAILVLKNTGSNFQKEIPLTSVDPRKWLPGQIIKVDLNVPIPTDVPNGTYNVYLWLPDASTNLRTRPEYTIRLANQNVWQPTNGFNLLFSNLAVGGTPVTSTPSPIETPTPTSRLTSTPTPTGISTPTPTPIIGMCVYWKGYGTSN